MNNERSASSSKQELERQYWPLHQRAYAVIQEEGVAGVLVRLQVRLKRLMWQFRPENPSDVYDELFFEESRAKKQYSASLAKWLVQEFAPCDVLDVGCGDSALLLELAHRGVQAYGFDGSAAAVRSAPSEIFLVQVDLNRPFLLNKEFALVCCIEVAEHLPKKSGKLLISGLAKHAQRRILFSAAHPGQGGVHHINEQPRQYWLDLFAGYGFREDLPKTSKARGVLEEAGAPTYLLQNLIVLHK